MRCADWEARLAAYIDSAPAFAWGRNDCGLFAAGAVEAMTGVDHGAPFRGRYRTELGAARALRRAGLETSGDAATAALGDPVPLLCLSRGDVVENDERAIGIYWPRGGPGGIFVNDDGLIWLPGSRLLRGWSVAHG